MNKPAVCTSIQCTVMEWYSMQAWCNYADKLPILHQKAVHLLLFFHYHCLSGLIEWWCCMSYLSLFVCLLRNTEKILSVYPLYVYYFRMYWFYMSIFDSYCLNVISKALLTYQNFQGARYYHINPILPAQCFISVGLQQCFFFFYRLSLLKVHNGFASDGSLHWNCSCVLQ